MSKRKATYSRADRGKYTSIKRKEAARKAIECRSNHLPVGLVEKVKACGDHLVML